MNDHQRKEDGTDKPGPRTETPMGDAERFVYWFARRALSGEHLEDEQDLISHDALRFQRDCDITEARGIVRAMGRDPAKLVDPAPGPDAIIAAGLAEHRLEHPTEGDEARLGRRAAVRGMMVRLGLYAEFAAALEGAPVSEAMGSEIDTTDMPEMGVAFFRSARRQRLEPRSGTTPDTDDTPAP